MRRLMSVNPTVHCLGVASCLGAPFPGCEMGPQALRQAGMQEAVTLQGLAADWQDIAVGSPDDLRTLLRQVADAAETVISNDERLLVLGGDHSITAGTWRGVGRALGEPPGLIWIDAHLDAHTPATTPSGNAHGMPLAALLGLGDDAMTGIAGPPLDPARVVVIGVRSYEPEEITHLAGRGVRVYGAEEVDARGLAEVFSAARRMTEGRYWGISLDLDALDPGYAPGVSTPVVGGLSPQALLPLLRGLLRAPGFAGLELVEYNPQRDDGGRTARVAMALAASAAAA